jgi:hypothetical protein
MHWQMRSFAVASAIPEYFDALLTRSATAEALSAAGFPIRSATLATKASRGGGPPFRRFGRIPLYRWGDALDWATSRLGPPICSTAELDSAGTVGRADRQVPVHRRIEPPRRPIGDPHAGSTSGMEVAPMLYGSHCASRVSAAKGPAGS